MLSAMPIIYRSAGVFIAASMLLMGCATSPIHKQAATQDERDAATLAMWQASGRMAVSGASGGSGSFDWSQNHDRTQVRLRGPVGIGSLLVTLDDHSLQLDAGNGPVRADEAQAQLDARLGAVVPMQALRYWLVGRAAPGTAEWAQASDSKILQQDDWRIEYQRYAVIDGVRLPTKLVATSGVAKVRIIIDHWRVVGFVDGAHAGP